MHRSTHGTLLLNGKYLLEISARDQRYLCHPSATFTWEVALVLNREVHYYDNLRLRDQGYCSFQFKTAYCCLWDARDFSAESMF
jgi:hypothetical protein